MEQEAIQVRPGMRITALRAQNVERRFLRPENQGRNCRGFGERAHRGSPEQDERPDRGVCFGMVRTTGRRFTLPPWESGRRLRPFTFPLIVAPVRPG
ncbi:hypothetical protein BH23GEM6_BH23GEM6_24980 [soil metagenome]